MTLAEKLKKIAENAPKVFAAGYQKGLEESGADGGDGGSYADGYNAGHTDGYGIGYERGEAQGGQVEYDRFWNAYQDNGNRTNYRRAFGGGGWNDETFKPKYDIRPVNASDMFSENNIENLVEILEKQGVVLDFSNTTNFSYTFSSARIKHLGVIDTRSSNDVGSICSYVPYLVTIDKLILREDGSQSVTANTINACSQLVNLTIEGTIGKSGITLGQSTKLSKASITSVLNALSTTSTGQSVTLSKTAVNKAFETSVEADNGSTSAEWLALVATRTNWTISLA